MMLYFMQHNKKPYSKKLGNLMDAEASRLIAEAYKRTEKLLRDNEEKLQLVRFLLQSSLVYCKAEEPFISCR